MLLLLAILLLLLFHSGAKCSANFLQAVLMQPGDNPPRLDLQTLPYSYSSTNLSSKLSNAIFVIFWVYCFCLLLLSGLKLHVTCQKVNSK